MKTWVRSATSLEIDWEGDWIGTVSQEDLEDSEVVLTTESVSGSEEDGVGREANIAGLNWSSAISCLSFLEKERLAGFWEEEEEERGGYFRKSSLVDLKYCESLGDRIVGE